MVKKFKRTDSVRYSRLGKKRKNLQKWRRPTGRHNKIRKGRFSYPRVPSVGYKTSAKEYGKLNGKKILLVRNMKELEMVDKNSVVIVAKIGAKKKIELVKEAMNRKIEIINMMEGKAKDEIRK